MAEVEVDKSSSSEDENEEVILKPSYKKVTVRELPDNKIQAPREPFAWETKNKNANPVTAGVRGGPTNNNNNWQGGERGGDRGGERGGNKFTPNNKPRATGGWENTSRMNNRTEDPNNGGWVTAGTKKQNNKDIPPPTTNSRWTPSDKSNFTSQRPRGDSGDGGEELHGERTTPKFIPCVRYTPEEILALRSESAVAEYLEVEGITTSEVQAPISSSPVDRLKWNETWMAIHVKNTRASVANNNNNRANNGENMPEWAEERGRSESGDAFKADLDALGDIDNGFNLMDMASATARFEATRTKVAFEEPINREVIDEDTFGNDAEAFGNDAETFGNDAETFGNNIKPTATIAPDIRTFDDLKKVIMGQASPTTIASSTTLPTTTINISTSTASNVVPLIPTVSSTWGALSPSAATTIGKTIPVKSSPTSTSTTLQFNNVPVVPVSISSVIIPPAPVEKDLKLYGNGWYYRDPSGNEQGPFTDKEMRGWYDGDYFPASLPLRRGDRMYLPLDQIFHDRDSAFVTPSNPSSSVWGDSKWTTAGGVMQLDTLEAQRRAAEEIRRQEEAKRLAAEEMRRKAAEELRRQEEARRLAEEVAIRRQQEERKAAEELLEKQRIEHAQKMQSYINQLLTSGVTPTDSRMQLFADALSCNVNDLTNVITQEYHRRELIHKAEIESKTTVTPTAAWGTTTTSTNPAPTPITNTTTNVEKNPPRTRAPGKITEIQEEEKKVVNVDAGKPAGAWGAGQAKKVKTLAEIQQEEARTAEALRNAKELEARERLASGINPLSAWAGGAGAILPPKTLAQIQAEEAIVLGEKAPKIEEINVISFTTAKMSQKERKAFDLAANKEREEAARRASQATSNPSAWGAPKAPTKSLAEIQAEEAAKVKTIAPSSSTPWGGASDTGGGLRAIQAEESRNKSSAPISQGGWSARVGQPSAYNQAPAPKEAKIKAIPEEGEMFWSSSETTTTTTVVTKPTLMTPAPTTNTIVKADDDNGMSKELSDWCVRELTKITGKGDLTLMKLLMTFDDPSEIRSYTSTYYGSTPAVSSFTTEFIRRKKEKIENKGKKVGKEKSVVKKR